MPVSLPFIDLENGAFTVPRSRFVLTVNRNIINIFYTSYEVEMDDCLVARVKSPTPLQLIAKGATLLGDRFKIVVLGSTLRIVFEKSSTKAKNISIDTSQATAIGIEENQLLEDPCTWVFSCVQDGATKHLNVSNHDFELEANKVVDDWMQLAPKVLPKRQAMVDQCWWTLGVNTIDLKVALQDQKEKIVSVVVPSKIGYVGLWQWDTYFICLGLAHANVRMALELLDVALYDCGDGQLPDVIHEQGILASSRDLPVADRVRLEAAGSQSGARGPVPLTKPPLGAWAANSLVKDLPREERLHWIKKWYPLLVANSRWWMSQEMGNYPIYAHPYSSGLDDCPVFDGALPVISPDLLAYLENQVEILENWAAELELSIGCDLSSDCLFLKDTRKKLHALLQNLFNKDLGMFKPVIPGQESAPRTIVSLLACFAGGLTDIEKNALAADIENSQTFASDFGLTTVARNEETYAPDRMWRGPVWINTNYLVAEGMERCGCYALAKQLREKTMHALENAGGPMEHFHPDTGQRAESSTVNFAWSAALYIDLAVMEAKGRHE